MARLHATLPANAKTLCLCSALFAGYSLSAQLVWVYKCQRVYVGTIIFPRKLAYQLAVSIRFANSGRAREVEGQIAHVVIGIGRASACCAQVRALWVEPLALEAMQLWECAAAACVVLAARPCSTNRSQAA